MRGERRLFPPLPSSANVFMTQIHAYLARARCQLVMHIPCTHLREIRRWEELVPVSFYPPPPLHPPLHLSCSSADAVGPLRAHLLCCRSFGPAGVWLGARWLGRHPRKSTQVSHGSIALTGPIKERQETDVRRKHIMQSPPSGAQTRRGFYTDIYKLMTWETLWRWSVSGASENNEFFLQRRCLNTGEERKHREENKATAAWGDARCTFLIRGSDPGTTSEASPELRLQPAEKTNEMKT